eukprot:5706053-Alexandrium_andersonii.AAC.1
MIAWQLDTHGYRLLRGETNSAQREVDTFMQAVTRFRAALTQYVANHLRDEHAKWCLQAKRAPVLAYMGFQSPVAVLAARPDLSRE